MLLRDQFFFKDERKHKYRKKDKIISERRVEEIRDEEGKNL